MTRANIINIFITDTKAKLILIIIKMKGSIRPDQCSWKIPSSKLTKQVSLGVDEAN